MINNFNVSYCITFDFIINNLKDVPNFNLNDPFTPNTEEAQKNWDTMTGILSHLQEYCNLATMSVRDAVEKITQN